tara:strand:+ start:10559 stop:12106 length:1548 start_codon:yes stop_codon:yes gene_type:complete
MAAWLYLTSVSVTNGSVTVSVTGGHDLSFVESGWSFDIGSARAEISSGTAPNDSGVSTLTLARPWAGANITGQEAQIVPTSGALRAAIVAMNDTNDYAIVTHQTLEEIATLDKDVTIKDPTGTEHTFATMPKIAREVTEQRTTLASDYATKTASLTISATMGYRNAVEKASGGRNTMILDAQGNENIMVVIPRFNCEDVNAAILAGTGINMQLGTGTHPAFRTNGADRGEFLIGKYKASAGAGGGCSVIGGVQPRTGVNYDTAKSLSANKGANWHMSSVWEWAAIALWSLANGTVPRGNTNYGRAHDARHETALRADNGMPGSVSGVGITYTGSGPDTWAHDHGAYGVQDLVGNISEWLDQMRLEDGRIITTLDNDPNIVEENWHRHTAYFDSTSSSQSGAGDVGSSVLNSTITNRNGPVGNDGHDNPLMHDALFSTIAKDPSYAPNEALRRLLIESAGDAGLTGALWVRNYGDRFPFRGGYWAYGSDAGLGALYLANARNVANYGIGFRPALFV